MNNDLLNLNRGNCPFRHENGNCLPIGGFCTAVNETICDALQSVYLSGYYKGKQEAEPVQKWIPVSEPPKEYRDKYGELIPFLVCEKGTEYPFRGLYDGNTWGDGLTPIYPTHWMPLPSLPKGE